MTISAFAKQNKVSRQAIDQAIEKGQIETHDVKRNGVMRKHIDPDHPKNRAYCDNANIGKRLARKPLQINAESSQVLPVKSDNVGENAEPVQDGDANLPIRYTIANVRLKEQQAEAMALKNAVRRGELLEREKTYILFMHLDKLHSNLERLADSFLADVAMEIIDAKRLTSETRARWKDEIFRQTNDAKEWIKQEIKNIEESQKG